MNQVTAINTYSNADGSRKALAFDDQDAMMDYVHQEVQASNFTEQQVLWKGYIPNMLGVNEIKRFYRTVNGSLRKTLVKNYFLEVKHVRDPVPAGYVTPDKYVESFNNLHLWLDGKDWLLVWQT